MIFTGLCIYLLIGIILYMDDTRVRNVIWEMKNNSRSNDVFIVSFIIIIIMWLPIFIYAKASKVIEKHDKDGSN